MPDTKITALTAITTVDPAADVLPIVDVSDTSMAASGTTKKITSNQILGAGGTATLASATISGNLTLSAGTANGVPYLNASKVVTASDKLSFAQTGGFFSTTFNINSLLGSANYKGGIVVTEDDNSFTLYGGSNYKLIDAFGFSTPNQLRFYASNVEQYRIGASGVFTWFDGAGGTRMTLNSTGLGVGIVPSSFGRFSVQGTAVSAGILGMNTDATRCDIQSYNVPLALNRAGNNITMCEGGGSVGIGVTPPSGNSAGLGVGTLGSSRQLQLSMFGSYARLREWDATNTVALVTNINVDNGIDNNAIPSWKVQLGAGLDVFRVQRAAAGSSTFATLATLDASGRLLVGPTSANTSGGVLQLSSGITFPATQVASSDANTLDDYEEGTWTGTLKGLTSDPSVAVTSTGRYTKIGRNVTIQISFEGVNTTGASGACYVTGLPFANGNVRTIGSAASFLGLTFTGTLVAIVDGSGTQIDFIDTRSNAAWVQAPHNAGSGRTISASLTYTV